uniref:X8 domain-containing protein n=1 Tax=Zea mays TaxID=4577 RepID=A0A804QGD4_MAIZE
MLAVRGLNSKMLEKRLHGCLLLLVFLLADVSGSRAETAVDLGPDSEDGSKRRSLATTMFCVAKQGADATALQAGLNWACGQGRANCAPIQPGGPCYKQNDLEALASYAYNDYYQKNFATGGSCGFNGTATTTTSDPSSGQCVFTGR